MGLAIKFLEAEEMSSFLVPERGIMKKHYNSSQDLELVISFDAYIDYINLLISKGCNIMREHLDVYKEAMNSYLRKESNSEIWSLYYKDIAYAILYEVATSTDEGKDCTVIRPDWGSDNNTIALSDINTFVQKNLSAEVYLNIHRSISVESEEILKCLQGSSFRNQYMYLFAIALLTLCATKPKQKITISI